MEDTIPAQTQATPPKYLHPKTWAPLLIIVTVTTGYLIWASQSKEWPFTGELPQAPSLPKEGEKGEFKDWQTYRNEEFGFEVKYPKDLKLETPQKDNRSAIIMRLVDPQIPIGYEDPPENAIVFQVSYWENFNEFKTNQQYKNYRELNEVFAAPFNETDLKKIGELFIDDVKAHKVLALGRGSWYSLFLEKNGIYQLFFGKANDFNENKRLGGLESQILSTFKFTK